jgi:hypothetical protein
MRTIVLPAPLRRRLLQGGAAAGALATLPGLALAQAARLDPTA